MKDDKNKEYSSYLFILTIITLFPMLQKGIMCNDELLLRKWAQGGIKYFFRTTFVNEYIDKGRILGVIGNLKFLSYISDNKYFFGAINLSFIVIAVMLYVLIINKLFKEKTLALLTGTMILAFLPFTFEFSVPNAFVIVTLQPMIFLEIAILYHLRYLEKGQRRNAIISAIFFLWSMFLYEFLITYVFVFTIIYLLKKSEEKIIDAIKRTWYYYVTAILYLGLYVGQSIVFPTNYSGTQMGIKSIKDILRVLRVLFSSSFPTYFSYFNEKYKYMFRYYNDGNVKWSNIVQLRYVIYFVVLFILLKKVLSNSEKNKKWCKKDFSIIAIAIIYAILPALPNSLSLMYQDGLNEQQFITIPVSIYLYFSTVFGISYILWKLFSVYSNRYIITAVSLIICILGGGVQIRNVVFINEQERNYNKITNIENVLSISYWKQFGKIVIDAPSLYTTMNSLAIEPGHWTEYSSRYNDLCVDGNVESADAKLEMQEDGDFYFYTDKWGILITSRLQKGEIILDDINNKRQVVQIGNILWKERNYIIYDVTPIYYAKIGERQYD